jgi:hypothetical protein
MLSHNLQKLSFSLVSSFCSRVSARLLRVHFHKIWYWGPLESSVEKFRMPLKLDTNTSRSTWIRNTNRIHSGIYVATLKGFILLAATYRSKAIKGKTFLLFRSNNGYVNAPSYCIINTVLTLFHLAHILTWICLTAGGYVRSDASDLMLVHSRSHKWHHVAAAMSSNNVLHNSYNTRPLLCARIFFSINLALQSVTSLTALFHI